MGVPDKAQSDNAQSEETQSGETQSEETQSEETQSEETLTALERAIQSALASASREQVLRAVVAALPPGGTTTSGPPGEIAPERFHGRVQKVSVSMPEELSAAIRERTGPGEFSRFVTEAAEKRLRNELLGEYLDELDRVHGPVRQELLDWAEQLWRDLEA